MRWAEDSRDVSLAWYLIAAALCHAVLWQASYHGLLKLPEGISPLSRRATAPIEVEKFSDPDSRLPVVQTDKADFDRNLLKEKKAKYAGEFDNRVEEESRSQATGKFMPGAGELLRQRAQAMAEAQRDGNADEIRGEPDGDIPKEDLVPLGRAGGLGMSDLMAYGATPNKFPTDVKPGPNTLLNTDKVMYASYINRIADEIYDPWVVNAQEAASTLKDRGKSLDDNVYITRLGVVLDDKGAVTSIQVLQSSGIDLFDESAKKAFWSSDPFPNPPSQLFDAQRRIKLVYDFHFEWKSSSFGVFPRRI
jgi:TonB family protein